MILIACVDENNGIMFNHRRLSRDREVSMRILEDCNGQPLYMDAYSQTLFAPLPVSKLLCVSSDFLDKCGKKDYCFIEDQSVDNYWSKIESVIVYRWLRKYPSDRNLEIPEIFELGIQEKFRGHSHDEIQKEVYWKKEV